MQTSDWNVKNTWQKIHVAVAMYWKGAATATPRTSYDFCNQRADVLIPMHVLDASDRRPVGVALGGHVHPSGAVQDDIEHLARRALLDH